MTKSGSTRGARAQRADDHKEKERYYGERKKLDHSKDFLTFRDKNVIELIETYSHSFRLLLYTMWPAETVDDGIAALATDAYEQAHISGHMKDENATEYGAYIDYCEFMWSLFGQLRNEIAAATLLDGPTFDDTTATTNSVHRFMKPESFNTLIETLEARNLVVPNWILYLLKKLTGVRIKLTESYEIYGTTIPSTYFIPGVRHETLSDLETRRNNLVAEKGNALQHMNKFGISYTTFSPGMITEVREMNYPSPEAITWFQHLPFHMYGKAKDLEWRGYGQLDFAGGTNWAAWYAYLYQGQVPEDLIYSQCFDAHDATNNQYGGLFAISDANNSEGDTNILRYAKNDATPGVMDIYNNSSDRWIQNLWFQVGVDDLPAAGEYELAFVGTELTANLIYQNTLTTYPPLKAGLGIFQLHRTNQTVSKTILDSFLLKKVIEVTQFK